MRKTLSAFLLIGYLVGAALIATKPLNAQYQIFKFTGVIVDPPLSGLGTSASHLTIDTSSFLTNTSLIANTAFGIHTFTGSGTGPHGIKVTNSTSSTTNYTEVSAFSSIGSIFAKLQSFSALYTPTANWEFANGSSINGGGSNGLTVAATRVGSQLRFYSAGTLAGRFDASQNLFLSADLSAVNGTFSGTLGTQSSLTLLTNNQSLNGITTTAISHQLIKLDNSNIIQIAADGDPVTIGGNLTATLVAGSITSGFGSIDIGGDSFTGTNVNLTGNITSTAAGTSTFTGTNAVEVAFRLRNLSTGTSAFTAIWLGNDGAAATSGFALTSTLFNPTGTFLADALWLGTSRAGGFSIVASNASGFVRFFSANTLGLTLGANQNLLFGSAAAPSGSNGIVLPDGTALSSMGSNTAGIYGDDVSGTVHPFAISEAGVTMQLTGAANNTLATAVQDNITQLGSLSRQLNLKNYTVATLPAGTRGDIAYVTDATAPTFLATLTGGGAVVTPAFYNGTNWVAF